MSYTSLGKSCRRIQKETVEFKNWLVNTLKTYSIDLHPRGCEVKG